MREVSMSSKQITTIVIGVVMILIAGGCSSSAGSTAPTPAPVGNQPTEQEASVNLTVDVPSILDSLFTDRLIKAFENAHPGVTVSLVKMDASIPPAAAGLDKHLQAVQDYTSSA